MSAIFLEELSRMIIDYYAALLKDAKDKSIKEQRVNPEHYHERLLEYGSALEDVLRRFAGESAAINFNQILLNSSEDLVKQTKQLQLEFDVNYARKKLTDLCGRYPSLSDLLSVMSYKDVIRLEKNSHRAMSLLVDDIEDFEDEINAMREKYKL
jgi:hypothetical protein